MTREPTVRDPSTSSTGELGTPPSNRLAPASSHPVSATGRRDQEATVGGNLIIKGEIAGSQSLHIDGRVEGAIKLPGCRVTIGPSGVVLADIWAAQIVIVGRVRGVVTASDRVEIRREGSLVGDVVTARISIEDGAYFKGRIDIRTSAMPTHESERAISFTLAFDPNLSPNTIESILSALADYYRVCGGVGFEIDSEVEPVTVEEKVHA